MVVEVDPNARDVIFRFKDSCNCCCWHPSVDLDTVVYINTQGEAVRFDPSKADDELTALKRSVSNLRERIEELAERSEELRVKIDQRFQQERLEAVLDVEDPEPITLGILERINVLMLEIFNPSPEKGVEV